MSNQQARASHGGGCLCGAVRYLVRGPLRPVVACHCSQCRRSSGHFVAATACRREHLEITGPDDLAWYRSSPGARRGFCQRCGSSLFWQSEGNPNTSIMAGTLDQPTGLTTAVHIFVEDAGDYYEVPQDAPHIEGGDHGIPVPDA
ncbi:MAG: GFA family protein [Kiloniellales bacterium]